MYTPRTEFDGYRLVRVLGRGGMGEVHLAHDTLLDRHVAIKFITSSGTDDVARERFLVEARAIARLQHPNVVSIYRVGEVDGYPYLVSEYVRGEPLDEVPMPVSATHALRVSIGIACGLAAAHRQGVIHRDLKPANAIFSDEGVVKLLDFGIAKIMESSRGGDSVPAAETAQPQDPDSEAAEQSTAGDVDEDLGMRETMLGSVEEFADVLPLERTMAAPSLASADTLLGKAPVDPAAIAAAIANEATMLGRSTDRTEATQQAFGAGLTRLRTEELTIAGAAMGTPQYMAPEVWMGEPATFRSDIYSFGAMMYALCTGSPPHTGDNLQQLLSKAISDDARPLLEAAPHIEPRYAAIIDRCIRRDPEERFASGNDVRAALEKLSVQETGLLIPEGNPYRGLHTFEAEHQHLFFGRDSEIRMILERLNVESFVLVAGDSGVGKSSLCRAGALPRVAQWFDPNRNWRQVTLVPGKHPVTSLSAILAPLLELPESEVASAIREDPGGVGRSLRVAQQEHSGVVIFIDQLEELTTISDPQEAAQTAEVLGWLTTPAPGIRVLATTRADFLSRLAMLPNLGDEISRALYFLRPLSGERIREAVVGPATAKSVSFESQELIDELVASTVNEEGGLPLLQFALAELWEVRDTEKKTITAASLSAMEGVVGALNRHADNVLEAMLPAERAASKDTLLALVTPEGTRTRKTDLELNGTTSGVKGALDAFVRGRLLVARETPAGTSYEIAHEALIKGWRTLARWLSDTEDERLVRKRLRIAVTEWERLGHSSEVLWSARQVYECRELGKSDFEDSERAFLRASQRAVRRRGIARLALIIGIPLLAASIYGGIRIKGTIDLARQVDEKMSLATAAMSKARALQVELEGARASALTLFDEHQPEAAEKSWDSYQGRKAELLPAWSEANRLLETALLLDRGRSDVRRLFAELLFERALIAENDREHDTRDELLHRLFLYDTDGAFRQRWEAPGLLSISGDHSAASLSLKRYLPQTNGKLSVEEVDTPGIPLKEFELPQGSYLARIEAPGRAPETHVFVIERDERHIIKAQLKDAQRVPDGYVVIPAGSFLFGSGADDGLRRDFYNTVPIHTVQTPAYLIARHETTFGDWIEYLNTLAPSTRSANAPRIDKGGFQGALELREESPGNWQISFQPSSQLYTARSGEKIVYPKRSRRAAQDWLRFPVVGISVDDAERYTRWLDSSGRVPSARLCTEYEWERAARGADGRGYPHGERLEVDDANFDDTYEKEPLGMGPDEVGSHPASRSPFGLYDMAGNVWEWTRSSLTGEGFAARGGSYYFGANTAKTSEREVTEATFKDVSVGMRVCADLIPPGRPPLE